VTVNPAAVRDPPRITVGAADAKPGRLRFDPVMIRRQPGLPSSPGVAPAVTGVSMLPLEPRGVTIGEQWTRPGPAHGAKAATAEPAQHRHYSDSKAPRVTAGGGIYGSSRSPEDMSAVCSQYQINGCRARCTCRAGNQREAAATMTFETSAYTKSTGTRGCARATRRRR